MNLVCRAENAEHNQASQRLIVKDNSSACVAGPGLFRGSVLPSALLLTIKDRSPGGNGTRLVVRGGGRRDATFRASRLEPRHLFPSLLSWIALKEGGSWNGSSCPHHLCDGKKVPMHGARLCWEGLRKPGGMLKGTRGVES